MNARPFISTVGLVLAFVCGCQSPSPKTQPSGTQPPAAVITQPVISPSFTWSIPPDFPTFGTATADSIRVAVFGYSIKKRGYYYLSRGATVHDAMQAGQFSGFVWWKRPYCGIQRQRPDGSVETIWFTQASRAADEQRVLQNDDRLKISHEVY
jgi:hypothetical protein